MVKHNLESFAGVVEPIASTKWTVLSAIFWMENVLVTVDTTMQEQDFSPGDFPHFTIECPYIVRYFEVKQFAKGSYKIVARCIRTFGSFLKEAHTTTKNILRR